MFRHNKKDKFDNFLDPLLKCKGFILLGIAISSHHILMGRGACIIIIILQEGVLSLKGRSAITVQNENTGGEFNL